MRRMFVIMPAVLALSMAGPAAAETTIGGEVFGAFNTYAMNDWNDLIDAANTGGAELDQVSGGITGGLGARMWTNPNLMLSLVWEPLFLETEDSNQALNLDGNSFQLGFAYFFPSQTKAKYGLGAGLGLYSVSGEATETGEPDLELEGTGVGFHLMGHGEWTVSPGFAVTAGAGYRVAEIELDEPVGFSGIPDADYSGFMGRLGLALYLSSAAGN